MAYNKQVNPYGIASSELDWAGFADGGRITPPGAIAPPQPELLSELAVLGMSAALEGDGDLFGPSATGKIVGGDAMTGVDKAMLDVANAANVKDITSEDKALLSTQMDRLTKLKASEAKEKAFWEAQANPAGNYYEGDTRVGAIERWPTSKQKSLLDAQMRGLNNHPYVETTEVVPSEFFDKNRLDPRWKPNEGFNFKQPKWFKDFDKDDYLGWTKKEFWGQ